VLTGDDFGFSRGVNRAMIEAHERGVLTSASLMVTGDAWEEAADLARSHPRLGVGLHLVVVSGRAVVPPSEIPHLVDDAGRFASSPTRAGLAYQFRPAARSELRREIRAQLERFLGTGLPLSHVDGHLHMHMHPVVMGILAELAAEFRVPAVRLPSEEFGLARLPRPGVLARDLAWSWIFGRLRRHGERRLERAGVGFAERVYGLFATGRLDEGYLLDLLPKITADFSEIYCHPALDLDGDHPNGRQGARELSALTSSRVREAIEAEGFELTTYARAAGARRHVAEIASVAQPAG
jgi:hopanoid biosynthesis associated protein HpnK